MNADVAYLLGVLTGQAMGVAACVYARHAVRAALSQPASVPDDPAPASAPAEPSAPPAEPVTVPPAIMPAQVADLSPIDFGTVIAQGIDPTVILPVIDNGEFLGALHMDARTGTTTQRETLYDAPPPEGT